jgi:alcohol dehydrogenase, propanol-preferring
MRAAVVTGFKEPLEVRDVDVPKPGPGQVLVRIEASGLCHTDIHAAHGDWPVKPKLPLIPGHEGVGRIVELGEGVDTLALGDRVALPWLALACGRCRYCIAGHETYCQQPQYMGYTIDGGYAEYTIGYASHVVRVPDSVSSIDAAPITCAGVTTYAALKSARPQPAETVMVVGHRRPRAPRAAVRHHVSGAARSPSTSRTRSCSWPKTRAPTRSSTHAAISSRRSLPLGGADIALVTVPSPAAMQAAHACLNPTGRLVLVGLPADNTLSIPVFETVLRGITVMGSLVGTRNDLADCFALHAAGRTQVITETRPLESVNECFDEVLAGKVPARLVFDFAG